MAKDVNIHLKTTGAEKTKQDLDKTGQSAKDVGDKTAKGQNKAGAATDKTTKKLGAMGRTLDNMKTTILSWIGAWVGLNTIIKALSMVQGRLEAIRDAQKTAYDQAIQFAEVGQALEIQTGTVGKQKWWTQQAIKLQKAGALPNIAVAGEMMTAMDVAFKGHGGVRDPLIRKLGMELAPFIGAAGYGPQETGKLFKFGALAGIEPTAPAYLSFIAKQHAAYTTSASTDPGAFLTGLQKGGTAYIGMGGKLKEALALYASTVAVTESEELAATLVKQAARVAGGQYPKATEAMEKSLGVSFPELSLDQRITAMLEHVQSIPENIRIETLIEQGFPGELTTEINKLLIPKAREAYEDTLEAVSNATSEMIQIQADAYLESLLGKERRSQAESTGRKAARGPRYGSWQRRFRKAKDDLDLLIEEGKDRWYIANEREAELMGLEQLFEDLGTLEPSIPESRRKEYELFHYSLASHIAALKTPLVWRTEIKAPQFYFKRYQDFLETSESAQPEPATESPTPPPSEGPPVTNNFDHRIIHQTIFNPVVGTNKQDLRIEPPYLG